MWRDEVGVVHTASIGDPRDVIPGVLVESLEAAGPEELLACRRFLDDLYNSVFELAEALPIEEHEERFASAAVPVPDVSGTDTKGDLAEAVRSVIARSSPRWRLDILEAIDELLDEWCSSPPSE